MVSYISRIPDEVTLVILGHLDLHDKFFLSQTCRALRRCIVHDWEVEVGRLELKPTIDFWAGLAYCLPDSWYCRTCGTLHPVDTMDIPRPPILGLPCPSRGSNHEPVFSGIQPHHAQLALKYARMGNVYRQYLRYLTAPYTLEAANDRYIRLLEQNYEHFGSKRTIVFSVRPKIVDGRFLLLEIWVLTFEDDLRPFPDSGLGPITRSDLLPGPHDSYFAKCLDEPTATISFNTFTWLALQRPGREYSHCCNCCPADYAIIASSVRQVIIRAWHDFGTDATDVDMHEGRHEFRQDGLWKLSPQHQTYVPGSTRDLYSWSDVNEWEPLLD
ncbi:Fc.00g087970.m01.CDS01 [Cosmosporella sp. VM-42]